MDKLRLKKKNWAKHKLAVVNSCYPANSFQMELLGKFRLHQCTILIFFFNFVNQTSRVAHLINFFCSNMGLDAFNKIE